MCAVHLVQGSLDEYLNRLVFCRTCRMILEDAGVNEMFIQLIDPQTETAPSIRLGVAECTAHQIWRISKQKGLTLTLLEACRQEKWVKTAKDAKRLFVCVTCSLLQRETHWGIIVDFLAFVSCLCIHCINIGVYDAQFVDWISFKTVYHLNTNLGEWLARNRWEAFAFHADRLYVRSELTDKKFKPLRAIIALLLALTIAILIFTMHNQTQA